MNAKRPRRQRLLGQGISAASRRSAIRHWPAVVAVAAGLEDAGGVDRVEGGGEVLGGVDRAPRRGHPAERLDEALFEHAVLRGFERAAAGQELVAERGERGHGDVLELVSDHRAVVGEAGQRARIVPAGAGEQAADLGRNRIALGREHVAAIAEPRRASPASLPICPREYSMFSPGGYEIRRAFSATPRFSRLGVPWRSSSAGSPRRIAAASTRVGRPPRRSPAFYGIPPAS